MRRERYRTWESLCYTYALDVPNLCRYHRIDASVLGLYNVIICGGGEARRDVRKGQGFNGTVGLRRRCRYAGHQTFLPQRQLKNG